MDPNANLAEQDRLLQIAPAHRSRIAIARLRELRIALWDWLHRGGFAPTWGEYLYATSAFRQWSNRYAR